MWRFYFEKSQKIVATGFCCPLVVAGASEPWDCWHQVFEPPHLSLKWPCLLRPWWQTATRLLYPRLWRLGGWCSCETVGEVVKHVCVIYLVMEAIIFKCHFYDFGVNLSLHFYVIFHYFWSRGDLMMKCLRWLGLG